MYIEARIVALIIYLLVFMTTTTFCLCVHEKYRKIILCFYLLALCIMGFFYVPPPGEDLYRLFIRMKSYSNLTIYDIINNFIELREILTLSLYIFVNYLECDGLLPFIAVLITFGLSFNILLDSSKGERNCFFTIAFILLMSRGFFGFTIGNIRTMIAISIGCYAIYKEFYKLEDFRYNFKYYIIASMFHVSGVLIFVSRMCYVFFDVDKNKVFYWGKIVILLCSCVSIIFFYSFLFENILLKFNHYTEVSREGEGFFYIWEFIITIIYLLFTLYMIYINKKIKNKDPNKINIIPHNNRFLNILLFFCILEIIYGFIDYNVFFRFAFVFSILNIPNYFMIIKKMSSNNINTRSFNMKILVFSFIVFMLEISRGNLCSLKFWE